jgi:hypothetical protein
MATLDDAVTFVRNFARAELEAIQMSEDKKRDTLDWWRHLLPFFGAGVPAGLSHGAKPVERTLLQIKRYQHPKQGEVFRAYVSGNEAGVPLDYSFALYLAVDKGPGLKIVARALGCGVCGTSGKLSAQVASVKNLVAGGKCYGCKGSGWIKLPGGWGTKQGFSHLRPGKLLEVRKLTPPTQPECLADYNKLDKLSP